MYLERDIIERRLARVRRQLIRPVVWAPTVPFDIEVWEVPSDDAGRPGEPVPVDDALAAEFTPMDPGSAWGRPWSTAWFRLRATIPPEFEGRPVEAIVNIGFTFMLPGFQAEGLIWAERPDGTWAPERGVHPQNHTFRIADRARAGDVVELLVEAASNPTMFDTNPNPNSDITTAGRGPIYRLGQLAIAVVNTDVYELQADYDCLEGWQKELPQNEPRQNDIVMALGASLDALDPLDIVGTAAAARAVLAPVLARPAVPSAHQVSAIGHAHIDSAWLWPIRETVRKCSRTFSNVLRLMEDDPEFRFGCSQAAQYEWMKDRYPSLFADISAAVERGQWIPIGGQWVEADGNVTGGESHIRQLVHGQRFFREHFGRTCTEVWIPDVFGYPATLPQIFRLGGAERFLTQKLSWNRTNRFPHHTFWWEGIDGSRVYTHFPPVDTYNANFQPQELAHLVRNFADHGAAGRSVMPFGYGDGGGGPSREMLDRYHRSKDLEGGPRVTIESPEAYFDQAMAEYPDPPTWVGELYFEMHRGTYTSQARTKVGNRRSELALREAELWSVAAFGGRSADGYPAERLDRLWKTVLLHQFHDILPGSSIGWVHREAEATYSEVLADLDELIGDALGRLADGSAVALLANAAPHARDEVVVIDPVDGIVGAATQALSDGTVALRAELPAMGVGPAVALDPDEVVTATARSLSNGVISVTFGDDGSVTSLRHLDTGREAVAPGERANTWHLHHDLPLEFDAWDIEPYYRNRVTDLAAIDTIDLVDAGPLVGRIRVTRSFRSSRLVETFELRAGSPRLDVTVELDWHERDHLLKVAWPIDVSTTDVVRHIQYGHIRTPIHTNTTWDTARFELCAHHWIDVGEAGFGVALLNNGRYGHDVTRTRTAEGAPTTTMRLTVVKGAQYPDPLADLGEHRFTYSLMPHAGKLRKAGVLAEGYRLNLPVRAVAAGGDGHRVAAPVVSVDNSSVVVEAVKAAEDGSGDLIVRMWESFGGQVATGVRFAQPITAARLTDALEDGEPPSPAPVLTGIDDASVQVSLRPFQIATLRVTPG